MLQPVASMPNMLVALQNIAVVFLFVVVHAKYEQYTGWSSFIVEPSTEHQLNSLASVTEKHSLDFWAYPSLKREGIVIVKPEHQEGFLKTLEDLGITYSSHFADVKAQLNYENIFIQKNINISERAGPHKTLLYNKYQNIETINAYIAGVANRYPDKVKLVIPANSFEGRPIHYLKISTTNFEKLTKPVIFIDGGIHAREWISPPTVTWAIQKLVENVTEPDLLERFDWILLPVVNPDGYEYSITTSPLWRKTRSTDQHKNSYKCPGVDGNRNYDIFWGKARSSSNPCSDIYRGSKAFSEVETRVVRDIMHKYVDRIALYITLHSYGSMILYPWSNDEFRSSNDPKLYFIADKMANTINIHALSYFDNYTAGETSMILYEVSGVSYDYAYSLGVPLAYAIELPGHLDGFHLQPNHIEQVCRETWEGLLEGARMAGDVFVGKIYHPFNKRST